MATKVNSGKVSTIFLVLVIVILFSLTVISVFFFQRESDLRVIAESSLEQVKGERSKLEEDLKETKKQVYLLEEKQKEYTSKIDDLLDDLELEKGISAEIKKENATLKETLANENQTKEELRKKYEKDLAEASAKITGLQKDLDAEKNLRLQAEERLSTLQEATSAVPPMPKQDEEPSVRLDTIVVAPVDISPGKILSIDKKNNFVIVDLGKNKGVMEGLVFSIYRGSQYLGDVKVARVQPEMSAADILPPLTSRNIRLNDQVLVKK